MYKAFLFAFLMTIVSLHAETKILTFAGSTRTDSYNKKLVREAAVVSTQLGAKVTVVDLKDYPIPFYDADLEAKEGMPSNAKKLRELLVNSNAVIIASPQYNASVSAVLKNTLDWLSRDESGNGSRDAFRGKKFVIMSASPGKKGGATGLNHLRTIIEDCGGEVMKKQVCVPFAHNAFDGQGALQSAASKQELQEAIKQILE